MNESGLLYAARQYQDHQAEFLLPSFVMLYAVEDQQGTSLSETKVENEIHKTSDKVEKRELVEAWCGILVGLVRVGGVVVATDTSCLRLSDRLGAFIWKITTRGSL